MFQWYNNTHINSVTNKSAFGALWKICEDSAHDFLSSEDGTTSTQETLLYLLPVLIQKFDSPSAKVRENAIFCVNQFLALRAEPLMLHFFEPFIGALYQRAGDPETLVRVRVCQALSLVLEARPDALLPQMDNIVAFMLFCMEQTDDETLALEACEFWLSFAEQPELKDTLEGHVGKYVFFHCSKLISLKYAHMATDSCLFSLNIWSMTRKRLFSWRV